MIKKLIAAIILLTLFSSISVVFAEEPYYTYTYSYWGEPKLSPDAMTRMKTYDGDLIETGSLNKPNDIFSTANGEVYIVDTGNNRIVALDSDFKKRLVIDKFINSETKKEDTFYSPGGLFVTDDEHLYVADTENGRIVEFNALNGSFIRTISKPKTELLNDYLFKPTSLALDRAGRIYIIGKNVNLGVIILENDGSFSGFMGAKKVDTNLLDLFWRNFMTKEQIARTPKFVPTEYNNIAIDSSGFLYVTTNAIDDWNLFNYMQSKKPTDQYAPVKRLNPAGDDILNRFGFFPPGGDVKIVLGTSSDSGPSSIVDITIGKYGIYSILDAKRNKVFTYDVNGNLLFAFGGSGIQQGVFSKAVSICYKGDSLLVLDKDTNNITQFAYTQYGQTVLNAMNLTNQRQYDQAILSWKKVLKQNSNLEMAYSAIGQILNSQGKYLQALDSFKKCNDVEGYSQAYAQVRKKFIRKYIAFLLIGLVLLIFLLCKFFKKSKAVNINADRRKDKWMLFRQVNYGFHVIMHPFDGFWDLKHEKRGSFAGATVILFMATLSLVFQSSSSGFIYKPAEEGTFDLINALLIVLLPFTLWVVGNWCLTTLMDGEGKMRDIYMVTAYGLFPIALINIPVTIWSHFVILSEVGFLDFFTTVSFAWSFILIFFGIMVIHRFTLTKAILTTVCTIVCMAVILFLALLFINVIARMLGVTTNVFNEISYRM